MPKPDPQGLVDALEKALVGMYGPIAPLRALHRAAHDLMEAYCDLHNAATEFGGVFCRDVPSWKNHNLEDCVSPAFDRMIYNTSANFRLKDFKGLSPTSEFSLTPHKRRPLRLVGSVNIPTWRDCSEPSTISRVPMLNSF